MSATSPPDPLDPERARAILSRRKFLQGAGTAAAGGVLAQRLLADTATAEAASSGDVEVLRGDCAITLSINGEMKPVKVEPRTTLLDALRTRCEPALTGTKLVCDRGNCGACSVLLDGEPAYACLLLAVDVVGRKIRTIEGEGTPEKLSPLQAAFCKHDASMCGFCTPGFVMAITAALEKDPTADLAAIQASCSGNVCRCGTYPHIFSAALEAGAALAAGRKR